MNREKVIEVLNELQPKDQQVMSLSKDSALAFAYSFYRDATQLYLDVLRETFKDPRYLASGHPQRPVVIVVKYFPGLNLSGFPSWVTILSPKQRSFLLDESLIAHADFPVMVTGDTSLSLAMEYGKPAFLEVPRWKIRSIPQLIDHLAQQNSEYFSDPNHMKQLRRALGVMAFENIATEGRGQSMQNPKFWLELLLDPVFLQAQSQAFFQAKASMSLLEKSLRFMEYMESQPLSPDLSRDELSQLFLNI